MSFRLFIDECLSPELVDIAVAAGHEQSTCARNRGVLAMKDWELVPFVVDNDFTLVTHNAWDFRGRGAAAPGGLYAAQQIHAGLICLSSAHPMDIERQCRLFGEALTQLAQLKDLVNQALEVFEAADGGVTVTTYEIPKATG